MATAFLLLIQQPAGAAVYHLAKTDPGTSTVVSGNFLKGTPPMALDEFLKLTPGKYKKLTGRNLGLKSYAFLLVVQREYRHAIKKGTILPPEIDLDKEKTKFHWGAFFIGVLLALIGPIAGIIISSSVVVLICFLLGLAAFIFLTVRSKDKAYKLSLLFGYLIGLGIAVLAFLLLVLLSILFLFAFIEVLNCTFGNC
jgi:hypothetical protein